MDVSDRRLQVQLTQEAKIASDFSLFRAIFAFAGFVSALSLSKSIFDKLADGGVSAPPGAAPQIFNLSRGSFAFGETAESSGFCAPAAHEAILPIFQIVKIGRLCRLENPLGFQPFAGTDFTGGSAIVG